MGHVIHARRTPDGLRFREWSTVVDAYTTLEMTEAECRRYLLRDYSPRERDYGVHERDIPARLARAMEHGTSMMDAAEYPRDLDGPWDEERCEGKGGGCGGFHHTYNPRTDGTCDDCGEGADATDHGPRCVPANSATKVISP